jgi:phage-related minor tail protein
MWHRRVHPTIDSALIVAGTVAGTFLVGAGVAALGIAASPVLIGAGVGIAVGLGVAYLRETDSYRSVVSWTGDRADEVGRSVSSAVATTAKHIDSALDRAADAVAKPLDDAGKFFGNLGKSAPKLRFGW